MNNYILPINFNLPLFDSKLSSVDFLKSHPVWAEYAAGNPVGPCHFALDIKKDLSYELKQFFISHNQDIRLCEIFYKLPNSSSGLHTDSDKEGDYAKLNWILGGENSTMNWYSIKNKDAVNNLSLNIDKTQINSKVIRYTLDELEHVYSTNITGAALIQVGVPHNITNYNQERWAISIVFRDMKLGRRPTFAEAAEIFKIYINHN
jgi:hypothetical protein